MSMQTHHVSKNQTLLNIGQVRCGNNHITTLYDAGSSVSLITHSKAQQLCLKSSPVNITMTKVGNTIDKIQTKVYTIPLTDLENNVFIVHAYGIDHITSVVPKVNTDIVHYIFNLSHAIDLFRPHGLVDLLLGVDYCTLLPQVVKTVGNLQLLNNNFGYTFRGFHPFIVDTNMYINHINVLPDVNEYKFETINHVKDNLDLVFNEVNLTKKLCNNCQSCTECNKLLPITMKQDEELKLILKGLSYDAYMKKWTVTYPWIKDPHLLPNNFMVALLKLQGTEKRLKKLGVNYSESYSNQIDDMVYRNAARILSQLELNTYKGPAHYISHHEILKDTSSTTPFRLVFNSSASYNGHILNEYWAKGPDVLNSLFGVLLRFREGNVAFIGDVSKMFNSILLSLFDQHTHRFLWRNMKDNCKPNHYVLTAVPFGDKPSSSIAILAMKKTAELMKHEFPIAYKIIDRDSYVDDIVHSTDSVENAKKCMKDVELVLSEGGFHIKNWVLSGDSNCNDEIEMMMSDIERVLGLVWNHKIDLFQFKIKLNFYPKVKGVHSGHAITKLNIKREFPKILTKRQVLSQLSSVYDPMGFIAPAILQGKILMREVVTFDKECKRIDWDDPLPEVLRDKWYEFFYTLFDLEKFTISRCLKSSHDCINPSLVIFNDASTVAYGTCAYVRWQIGNNLFDCKLIASRSRLAPMRHLTVPKLELNSAVLATELRISILQESNIKFVNIFHLTDSEIVLGQISKSDIKIGTFVANRITLIRDRTSAKEWFWLPSKSNIADMLTRPNCSVDIGPSSSWQIGPDFLSLPLDHWKVKASASCIVKCDPVITVMSLKSVMDTVNLSIIQTKRFSSCKKLLRVTARLFNAFKLKSFKAIFVSLSPDDIDAAERAWIIYSQISITCDWQKRFQRLGPFIKNDIIHVGSRIPSWMKSNWNNEYFILLPSDCDFSRLCVSDAHDFDHTGVESAVCKIQSKFWIPKLRNLLRSVKNKCVVCRYLDKRAIGQSMGPISTKRLKPTPPFYHSALDLFGPVLIKDTVKGRCRKKVYGVVINCLVTRASYVDVVEGYDADSFLTTLRRFISVRGYPRTMYSDSGSQLVSANKELQNMTKKWNMLRIKNFGADEGMVWSFTKSADAPWENGCSEAMVKLVKRAMLRVIGSKVLTVGELQTVFFEISNLLNSRPIGIKPGTDITYGSYLCPNDLLLGRASVCVPECSFSNDYGVKARQGFINDITHCFWKRWMRDYFHTLVVRQKWHHTKRNLRPGDVVLVADSNALVGVWKLAQVCHALPSSDGLVRDVVLRYKIQKDNTAYDGVCDTIITRSVHRLVLILPIEEQ